MAESRLCSLSTLQKCGGELKLTSALSKEEKLCLKARSGIGKIKTVCQNHEKNYLTFYEMQHKYCCDAFNKHQRRRVSGTKTITISMYLKSKNYPALTSPLIPGQMLCKRCHELASAELKELDEVLPSTSSEPSSLIQSVDLFADEAPGEQRALQPETLGHLLQPSLAAANISSQLPGTDGPVQTDERTRTQLPRAAYLMKPPENSSQGSDHTSFSEDADIESSEDVFIPPSEAIKSLNKSLKALNESPINNKRLSSTTSYGPAKIMKVEEKIKSLMELGGAPKLQVLHADFYSKTILALKEKFVTCTSSAQKIQVLSVALAGLPMVKVMEIFQPIGASEWLVKKTALLNQEQGLIPTPAKKKVYTISDEAVSAIRSFYESDESSRQLPGKKDYVSVKVASQFSTRENGKRVHVQKKLLLNNLRELYELFKEHREIKVSFSKFASLRPPHCVLAGSPGTHSICVCTHHQNFDLLIEGAKFKNLNPELASYTDFISAVVCNPPTADCYLQECCKNCPGIDNLKEELLDLLSENLVENISYKQWTTVDRSSLEIHCSPIASFMEMFCDKLKKLLPHNFIAKEQARYLRTLKEELAEGEAIAICDFSENYSFLIQDCVQGFYWSNDQATVHPFVTYYKEGELKVDSFVVISDYMKHGVHSFYAFQKKFIEHLKSVVTVVTAQQYKNCYNMLNITYHTEDFGLQCEWTFFATSHGKGPSDGVGGTLKRMAARASIQGKLIRTAQEFYQWAAEEMKNIRVCLVTSAEVETSVVFLDKRFKVALSIDKIRSNHSFIPLSAAEVSVSRTSFSEKKHAPVGLVRKVPAWATIEEGGFVTVQVGVKWSLVQVTNMDPTTQEILVSPLTQKRRGSHRYSLPDSEKEVAAVVQDVLSLASLEYNKEAQEFILNQHDLSRTVWQLKVRKKIAA